MNGSTGIGVAIIDSGIAPSADFAGRITAFYDFTNGAMAWPSRRTTTTATARTSPD